MIDDAQNIHFDTLSVLQQFMDDTPYVVKRDGRRVNKNRAWLGILTDFGREGRTADMTFSQLERLVLDHSAALWDLDPKQHQLIQFTIPFQTLSDSELEEILAYLLTRQVPTSDKFKGKIARMVVEPSALTLMREEAQEKYPKENGRGIRKWVINTFVPRLGRALTDQPQPLLVTVTTQDHRWGIHLQPSLHLQDKEL